MLVGPVIFFLGVMILVSGTHDTVNPSVGSELMR